MMIHKILNYKTSSSVIPARLDEPKARQAKAGIQPKRNNLPIILDSRSPIGVEDKFRGNDNGFILLVVFLVVFMLLLMAIYFFSFIITELKISKNQAIAEQTYYLAEAGVEETIWKLKFDNTWKTNFENGNCNPCQFSRENVFFANGSYSVQVQSTGNAKGEVTATGIYTFFTGKSAQRIIKIKVFKALNSNPVEDIALFTGDGDIIIFGNTAELTDGGLFSNDDIYVLFFSDVHTTENASATDDIYVDWFSDLDADGGQGENQPPIEMPMVDFDSDDPESYKNKADNIYNQNEFKQMLDNANGGACNCELHIYGITYVTGQVNIKRGTYLHVHGALVADGTITLGQGGQTPPNDARLYVYHTTGEPSGLLTKGSISTKNFASRIEAAGLLYASDSFNVTNLPLGVDIDGGVIARQISAVSLWTSNQLNIIYDNEIVMTALGQPAYSPVVTVEHWEEQY